MGIRPMDQQRTTSNHVELSKQTWDEWNDCMEDW